MSAGQPAEVHRVAKLRFTNSSPFCVDGPLARASGAGGTTAKRRAGSGIIAQLTRGKTRYNEGVSLTKTDQ